MVSKTTSCLISIHCLVLLLLLFGLGNELLDADNDRTNSQASPYNLQYDIHSQVLLIPANFIQTEGQWSARLFQISKASVPAFRATVI